MAQSDLPAVPLISPLAAHQLLKNAEAIMIDVREADEWDEVRCLDSEFRPMSSFADWCHTLPKDKTIIVQCRTGNRSGQIVHALMHDMNMDNAVNLEGGLVAWIDNALPISTQSV